jgi:hypothetical protein
MLGVVLNAWGSLSAMTVPGGPCGLLGTSDPSPHLSAKSFGTTCQSCETSRQLLPIGQAYSDIHAADWPRWQ